MGSTVRRAGGVVNENRVHILAWELGAQSKNIILPSEKPWTGRRGH